MRVAHFSDLHLLDLEGAVPGRLFNKRFTGWVNIRLRRGHKHKPEPVRIGARKLAELGVDHVVVTGDVIFPIDLPAGPAAPIVVSVEDVSRADAPAVTLASAVVPASATPPVPGERVPFSIPISAYDARMTYSVRAHVDRDGDGRVSSGDLISTTHNPVLTRGGGTVVDVPLSVVG